MSDPLRVASVKSRLDGHALYYYSQLVSKTCTFEVSDPGRLRAALSSERPVIFASWHGMSMMVVPMIQHYCSDLSNFSIITPDDWRGAALRVWADRLGAAAFTMELSSASAMSVARQTLSLTRRLAIGERLFINPDGPDGPAHVIKPGLSFIARKSRALVLPIGAYCRHAYNLPRWDRYSIPCPYSRIACHVAEPIATCPSDDTEAREMFTIALNRATLQAAADYYERCSGAEGTP